MRAGGVLMHLSSLPGACGIGSMGEPAFRFIDFLKEAGQTFWQLLPLGPSGWGNSPYEPLSAFAGNPYYISLEELMDQGLLFREECRALSFGEDCRRVDYGALYENRLKLLRKAYDRSRISHNGEFQSFVREEGWWLWDYALFMAVKERFGGLPWSQWAEDIRYRWGNAMEYYHRELKDQIQFHQYTQYLFYSQWKKLKAYANQKGVALIGDLPFYVAQDSADVWTQPHLFKLGEGHAVMESAGSLPDRHSAEGQVWGMPLYRWDSRRETGYDWWLRRIRQSLKMYDGLRLDHFRGFESSLSIPAGAASALEGIWEKGPGLELIRELRRAAGDKLIFIEDGENGSPELQKMTEEGGFFQMKVLEAAFGGHTSLPHTWGKDVFACTGTHDDPALRGWLASLGKEEKSRVQEYLGAEGEEDQALSEKLIRLAMRTSASLCIIPLQDYLGLGDESRLNIPATTDGNWTWRMEKDILKGTLKEEVRRMTRIYGRLGWQ